MRRTSTTVVCLCLALGLGGSQLKPAFAQNAEERTIAESITVLNEIMTIPNEGIPQGMLRGAHAVAIIPNVLKGSFVVGARYGNGVLLVRDHNGGWHAPVFISLGGGNVGWQIGVQSTDVLLVFKTPQSVQGLLDGKFTIGADAAVAAGPVGRQASAATDARLASEIFSWSRSRGLFAGVSLDGSVVKVESGRNANYYRPTVAGGPVVVPEMAQSLARLLLQYSGVQVAAPPIDPNVAQSPVDMPQVTDPATQLAADRNGLAQAAKALYPLLDQNWQNFLALPPEVFGGASHPTVDALRAVQSRYEQVLGDGRYGALANNPQFQTTYDWLKRYLQSLSATAQTLQLPAPPTAGR